jgi:predicted component of type VI protein secretion system
LLSKNSQGTNAIAASKSDNLPTDNSQTTTGDVFVQESTFSPDAVLAQAPQIRQLLASTRKSDKRLANRILKNSSAFTTLEADSN